VLFAQRAGNVLVSSSARLSYRLETNAPARSRCASIATMVPSSNERWNCVDIRGRTAALSHSLSSGARRFDRSQDAAS
jgi:hypothetical protein